MEMEAVTSSRETKLDFSILSLALRGVTFWRSLVVFAASYFFGLVLFLLLSSAHSVILGLIGGIVLLVFVGAGYMGAGGVLAAFVQDRQLPGILGSFLFGLTTLPRFIGLIIIEYLLILGLIIVEIILIEICRIPVLGGMLSLGVYPVLFLFNVFLVLGAFVMFSLTGPALWFGETIGAAFTHLVAMARSRSGAMLMLLAALAAVMILLTLLLLAIGAYSLAILSGLVGIGHPSTMGMIGALYSNMMGLAHPGFAAYGANPFVAAALNPSINDHLYLYAGLLSVAMYAVLVIAIPNNVLMLGLAYLYDRGSQEVDRGAANEMMAGFANKVSEVAERTRNAAEQAKAAAVARSQHVPSASPASPSASEEASKMFCKACGARLQSEDRFCGECGKPV